MATPGERLYHSLSKASQAILEFARDEVLSHQQDLERQQKQLLARPLWDEVPAELEDISGVAGRLQTFIEELTAVAVRNEREMRLYGDALQALRSQHVEPSRRLKRREKRILQEVLDAYKREAPGAATRRDIDTALERIEGRRGEMKTARTSSRAATAEGIKKIEEHWREIQRLERERLPAVDQALDDDMRTRLREEFDVARLRRDKALRFVGELRHGYDTAISEAEHVFASVKQRATALDPLEATLKRARVRLRAIQTGTNLITSELHEDLEAIEDERKEVTVDDVTGLPLADRGLRVLKGVMFASRKLPPTGRDWGRLTSTSEAQTDYVHEYIATAPVLAQVAAWLQPFNASASAMLYSKDVRALALAAATVASCAVRAHSAEVVVHCRNKAEAGLLLQEGGDINIGQAPMRSLAHLHAQYEVRVGGRVLKKANQDWEEDEETKPAPALDVWLLPPKGTTFEARRGRRLVIATDRLEDDLDARMLAMWPDPAVVQRVLRGKGTGQRALRRLMRGRFFNVPKAPGWFSPGRVIGFGVTLPARAANPVLAELMRKPRADPSKLLAALSDNHDFATEISTVVEHWKKTRKQGGVQAIYTGSLFHERQHSLALARRLHRMLIDEYGFGDGADDDRHGEDRSNVALVDTQRAWEIALPGLAGRVAILIVPDLPDRATRFLPSLSVTSLHMFMPIDDVEVVVDQVGPAEAVRYARGTPGIGKAKRKLRDSMRAAVFGSNERAKELRQMAAEEAVNAQALRVAFGDM